MSDTLLLGAKLDYCKGACDKRLHYRWFGLKDGSCAQENSRDYKHGMDIAIDSSQIDHQATFTTSCNVHHSLMTTKNNSK